MNPETHYLKTYINSRVIYVLKEIIIDNIFEYHTGKFKSSWHAWVPSTGIVKIG